MNSAHMNLTYQRAKRQWVITGYMLAFASVIPVSGWATARLGARQVWIASLATFMLGSVLAGLAWSVGALIAFRRRLGPDAHLPRARRRNRPGFQPQNVRRFSHGRGDQCPHGFHPTIRVPAGSGVQGQQSRVLLPVRIRRRGDGRRAVQPRHAARGSWSRR